MVQSIKLFAPCGTLKYKENNNSPFLKNNGEF